MGSRTRHANRGKGWETKLDDQHTRYRAEARAVIFQAHPGTRVVGGRAIRQKAPPDFFGVVNRRVGDGLAVLFDAKRHEGTRWPLAKLERHQAVALEAWQVNGGLAGIALWLNGHTFWIDWNELGPLWWGWEERETTRASLDLDWLRANAANMKGGPDWLAVAL